MSLCCDSIAVKGADGIAVAATLKCRSWTCPECEPGRKAGLIAQCHRGQPTTFLTLTLRRIPGRTPEQAAKALTRAWRLLRLRILRHRKMRKLPFAAVMEAHVSGFPHLHILLRTVWLDQKWLSDQMQDIADSPIVHIERIDNRARINAYVAKYCGKSAHKFGTSKRYYFSQDWQIVPRQPWHEQVHIPGKWQVERMKLCDWVAFKKWALWEIEELSRWKAIARRPVEGSPPS